MRPRRRRTILLVVLASLACLTPSTVDDAHGEASITGHWRKRLQDADRALLAGQHRKAKRIVGNITRQMMDYVVHGGGDLLGQAAGLRALAAAGLGDEREARWFWVAALQLFPRLQALDLAPYGETAQILVGVELPVDEEEPPNDEEEELEVVPPKKLSAPGPDFPAGARGRSISLVVEAIIDRQGLPTRPRILHSAGELTMVWATLEALNKWRFEPATLDGRPVAVTYNLTVNFKSRPRSPQSW